MYRLTCKKKCCVLYHWVIPSDGNYDKRCQDIKAGAVIKDTENRLLLVQSRNSKWGFPKGECNIRESLTQCACREVKEETGLTFTSQELKRYPVHKLFHTTLYYIENFDRDINVKLLKKSNNTDVSGIGWINLDCLSQASNIQTNRLFKEWVAVYLKPPKHPSRSSGSSGSSGSIFCQRYL